MRPGCKAKLRSMVNVWPERSHNEGRGGLRKYREKRNQDVIC